MVLPATAEPEGYLAEKAKGNIKTLPPKGVFEYEIEMGTLEPRGVERIGHRIAGVLAQ